MDGWEVGLFALLGVVIGGGLSHISAMQRAKQEKRWEIAHHKRDKLEELSIVLDDFENLYRDLSGAALLKLNNDQPMQRTSGRIPNTRLTTLIEFYAPELMPKKMELDVLTVEFGKLIAETITSSTLDPSNKEQLMIDILAGHTKIEDKCRELAAQAAEIVQREVAN